MLQSKKDSGVQTARGQGADHRFARYARPTCRHSKGLELTAGARTPKGLPARLLESMPSELTKVPSLSPLKMKHRKEGAL